MKHTKLSLSTFTRLFTGSPVSRKGAALSRCKTLRLEPLEDRRLLDATTGTTDYDTEGQTISELDYAAIRAQYPELSNNIDDQLEEMDVLVVDLSEGGDNSSFLSALKGAIESAMGTPGNDLIVVKTVSTCNTITYSSSNDELSVSLSEDTGSVTIVSLGFDSQGKVIPLTLNANQKSRVMSVSSTNEGTKTYLGGIVFANGNSNNGAGLDTDSVSKVYIEKSTFINCTASSGQGGGINNNGSLSVFSSKFTSNLANEGGGVYLSSSTGGAILNDCVFENNSSESSGAGLYNDASNISLEKCSFTGNVAKNNGNGGAIYNSEYASLNIGSANIRNNKASNGAGIYNEGMVFVFNSLLASNTATKYGGGVYLYGVIGSAEICNCTIASNQAEQGGGINYSAEGGSQVNNTIIAMNSVTNSSNKATADLYGSVSGSNCLVGQGVLSGSTLYKYENGPLFTNAQNGDYTLIEDSLAIEKGNNTFLNSIYWSSSDCDLAGNKRIVGTNVDIGAYEYPLEVTPPLSVPSSVIATPASKDSIIVSWSLVSDAAEYVIQRSTDSKSWSTVGTVNTNCFNNSGLTSGTLYYYQVQAVNDSSRSPFSSAVSAYTLTDQVTGLTVKAASSGGIQLSWTAVPRAKGYLVEQSSDELNWTALSNNVQGTTYTKSGPVSLATLYYRVCALNQADAEGEYSEIVADSYAPGHLIATAISDTVIELSWAKTDTAEGYVVEKYNGSSWETVATLTGASATTYRNTGLQAATEYQFRVKAIAGSESSEYATVAGYTTTTKPGRPSVTVLNSSQAILTWDNVPGAASYTVSYRKTSGGEYQSISCNTNTITLFDLAADSQWEATVAAVNPGGSVSSDPVTFRTNTAPASSGLTDAQTLTNQRAESGDRGVLFVNTLEDSTTLNPNDGWITLREAIAYAGTQDWGTTIQFSVSGTITLAREALQLSKSLNILADGIIIDAYRQSSGLSLTGTSASKPISVTLAGITVENGLSAGVGGGIACRYATLNLANSEIKNNEAVTFGGGLYADNSTIIIVNSAVSDNRTTGTGSQGGDAYGDGFSKIWVSRSTVSDNWASALGPSGIVTAGESGQSAGTISIKEDGNDVEFVSVFQNGSQGVYSVVLNSKPTSNVVVVLDVSEGLITSKRCLTFTPSNWDSAQTIHVGAVKDSGLEPLGFLTISHTLASSDLSYLSAELSDVNVSLIPKGNESLTPENALVLPADYKSNYNQTPQNSIPASATELTDWDAFYQEIWVEAVGLSAGATVTKTFNYNPKLFDVASDACLSLAEGVGGSFVKEKVSESETKITLTLTVNDPMGLSVQGAKLYLGSVLFTPNTENGAGLASLSETANVFGATVSTYPYDLKRSEDDCIDMNDFIAFAGQFNKSTNPGDPFNPADFDHSGTVNMGDFIVFAQNYNKKKSDALRVIPSSGSPKAASMAASLDCFALLTVQKESAEPVAAIVESYEDAQPADAIQPAIAPEPVVAEPVIANIAETSNTVLETDNAEPICSFTRAVSEGDSFALPANAFQSTGVTDSTARQDLFDNQTQGSFATLSAVRLADANGKTEDDLGLIPQAIDEALASDSFWKDEDWRQLGAIL